MLAERYRDIVQHMRRIVRVANADYSQCKSQGRLTGMLQPNTDGRSERTTGAEDFTCSCCCIE